MRQFDRQKLSYSVHTYEGVISGVDVAAIMGQEPEKVFKTLVTVGKSGGHYVFMIPVAQELDLKKAAKAAGDKSIELVAVKELLGLTGYIRGGCSPVGMKKRYPTHIDETCILYDEIAVSAGERGHQMIIPHEAIVALTDASLDDLIQ